MRKPMLEAKEFKNQKLMNELNEMMYRIKFHLFNIPGTNQMLRSQINMSLPSNEELDNLTDKIMEILKKDSKPMINYYD
jgi:hypothetical protein